MNSAQPCIQQLAELSMSRLTGILINSCGEKNFCALFFAAVLEYSDM